MRMTTVGAYQIVREIVAGGMAASYEAVDATTGKRVFVKVALTNTADAGALSREVNVYDRLLRRDCRCILNVVDLVRTDEYLALVTEYADGGDLEEHVLAHATPLLLTEVLEIGLEVAAGLAELHALDVVHRDLKPRNVLWHQGAWKLADFGISKNQARLLATRTFRGAGTKEYVAPEQLAGHEAEASADVYSLGRLLTFLACRKPRTEQPLEAPVARLIAHCTRTDPDRRPTVAECVSQMRCALTGLDGSSANG